MDTRVREGVFGLERVQVKKQRGGRKINEEKRSVNDKMERSLIRDAERDSFGSRYYRTSARIMENELKRQLKRIITTSKNE